MRILPEEKGQIDPAELEKLGTFDIEDVKQVVENNIEHRAIREYAGVDRFNNALDFADAHKILLGASRDEQKGNIDISDHGKTLFGIPMSAVKDFFLDKIRKSWVPAVLWTALAKLVGADLSASNYNFITKIIQRYGLLIENKTVISEKLKSYRVALKECSDNPSRENRAKRDAALKETMNIMHDITGL